MALSEGSYGDLLAGADWVRFLGVGVGVPGRFETVTLSLLGSCGREVLLVEVMSKIDGLSIEVF